MEDGYSPRFRIKAIHVFKFPRYVWPPRLPPNSEHQRSFWEDSTQRKGAIGMLRVCLLYFPTMLSTMYVSYLTREGSQTLEPSHTKDVPKALPCLTVGSCGQPA